MRLTFLGTRGGINARSSLHFMHSVLLIQFRKTSLLIDWGTDWLNKRPPLVDGILITHAHPDHVGGLVHGFPAPVYATDDTWQRIKHYPLDQHIIIPNTPIVVGSITIEAFEVYHSLHAPTVGYRITAGKKSLFYVSDLLALKKPKKALWGVDLYIGDGAIITRKILVREKQGVPTGHSPISEQLLWCQKYGVPQAIFTHCGSEITKGDEETVDAKIEALAPDIKTRIAFDGMHIKL